MNPCLKKKGSEWIWARYKWDFNRGRYIQAMTIHKPFFIYLRSDSHCVNGNLPNSGCLDPKHPPFAQPQYCKGQKEPAAKGLAKIWQTIKDMVSATPELTECTGKT